MLIKNREMNDLLPDFIRKISEASDPVFRTCEVLTRIDNLFKEDGVTPLKYDEKIYILKSLKKGLNQTLSNTFLISRSQGDPHKYLIELIDNRIEEYSMKKINSAPFPKIYERRSWGR